MPLKEIVQPILLPSDAHPPAKLGKSSAKFDSFGFENVFRSRLARTLSNVMGGLWLSKKFILFCLTGVESSCREYTQSKDTHKQQGIGMVYQKEDLGVTWVPSLPFWVCLLCSKFHHAQAFLSWRKWSMDCRSWHYCSSEYSADVSSWDSSVMEIKGCHLVGRYLGDKMAFHRVSPKSCCVCDLDPIWTLKDNPFSA